MIAARPGRDLESGRFARMGVVAGILIGRMIMVIAMKRMLDMLGLSPAWLAEEGQEHQAPAVEAGE